MQCFELDLLLNFSKVKVIKFFVVMKIPQLNWNGRMWFKFAVYVSLKSPLKFKFNLILEWILLYILPIFITNICNTFKYM